MDRSLSYSWPDPRILAFDVSEIDCAARRLATSSALTVKRLSAGRSREWAAKSELALSTGLKADVIFLANVMTDL